MPNLVSFSSYLIVKMHQVALHWVYNSSRHVSSQGGAERRAAGGGTTHRLTHKILEKVILWSIATQ